MPWAPVYVTTAELKGYVRIPLADTDDDARIDLVAEAASRAVDHHCNRQFGEQLATERFYTAEWDKFRCRYVVHIDDTEDAAPTVESDGDAVTDFSMRPVNAVANGRPFTRIVFDEGVTVSTDENAISVTADWGWSSVPDTIKTATLLQAARFFQRQSAPFGVAGSPDLGSELRLLQKVDVDVAVMLRSFVRWWGAA